MDTLSELNSLPELKCSYCQKLCKNKNSLKQHECRCSHNPNRKAYDYLSKYTKENVKGKNKYTSPVVAKQVATTKRKYAAGYVSPLKGKKQSVKQYYLEHNKEEIQLWLNYVKNNNWDIPPHSIIAHNSGYNVVSKCQKRKSTTVKLLFEHDFVANVLLEGKLEETNTVHHINEVKTDNRPCNLLIFKNSAAHKRYHTAEYAYLKYDSNTHMFDCYIKQLTM